MKFWQVDAFTNKIFSGNPAAVFILHKPIDDLLMQNIAAEMNLPETAFVLCLPDKNPYLRWFTPMCEIDLCGHATLSTAHIYFTEIDKTADSITFDTKFSGSLLVKKNGNFLTMHFPFRPGKKIDLKKIPQFVLSSLSKKQPLSAFKARDLMLVYDNEKTIFEMEPNFNALLDYKDFIIVTAKSNNPKYDFISRFFCPSDGILEDPVTGSAHCTLAPYWSQQLNKTKLIAYQASKRGGILNLELCINHLNITGQAITVIDGNMKIRNNENTISARN
ncbi:MAG: PhzF family phenazine biosynthesis protein [Rickettsiales bacterium]|nr:PhzF family phenazine biosynthesis protein [Rickettsiales bacterium]